ncbi:DUF5666 domain-containing protein [Kineococcus endophyticus]|uniref:DUF5666 domain-containing protein n=1 Tax=Kineococcus endophyticus TaxID=1181883 RepID=A0ABV3P6M8_9ACTN
MNRRTTAVTVGLVLAAVVALPTAGSAVAARPAGPEPTATSTATATATAPVTGRPSARPTVTRGVRVPQLVVAGTLAAVDTAGNRITVTVHGGRDKLQRGQDVVVALTSATVLRQGGAQVEPADLRVGGHVSVRATRAADGSLTATRVTVESGEDSPTSSPTSSPDVTHR